MKEIISEEKKDTTEKVFKITCKYCKREIKGSSKSQIEYLLIQHKLSKHKDKIKVEEIEK